MAMTPPPSTFKLHPRISSSLSNANHRLSKSILSFFCSPKRKQAAANPPASSEKYKSVTCLSKAASDASLHSWLSNSSKSWDTRAHEQADGSSTADDDDEEVETDSCFSFDFRLEDSINVEKAGDSEGGSLNNDAAEMEGRSSANSDGSKGSRFHLSRSQNKDTDQVAAAFNSARSPPIRGLGPLVVKIQKVMSSRGGMVPAILTKDAKRMLVSFHNKQKSIFIKRENRQQTIWTKPILMGNRCRNLDADFPYGDGSRIHDKQELP